MIRRWFSLCWMLVLLLLSPKVARTNTVSNHLKLLIVNQLNLITHCDTDMKILCGFEDLLAIWRYIYFCSIVHLTPWEFLFLFTQGQNSNPALDISIPSVTVTPLITAHSLGPVCTFVLWLGGGIRWLVLELMSLSGTVGCWRCFH